MFNRSRAMLVASLGVMALADVHPAGPASRSTPALEVVTSKKHKRGLVNGAVLPSSSRLWGISSLRISVAQGKRNATKRRNQLRHKRHLKG